jgi:hypothetical protein
MVFIESLIALFFMFSRAGLVVHRVGDFGV